MHTSFEPNWTGKTITKIETFRKNGVISDMYLFFSDGSAGAVGGIQSNPGYIACVTETPNDPSSPTANSNAPEQEAEKSRSVQRLVRPMALGSPLLTGPVAITPGLFPEGHPMSNERYVESSGVAPSSPDYPRLCQLYQDSDSLGYEQWQNSLPKSARCNVWKTPPKNPLYY